ncbi:lipoate--protein ligase family protein [Methanomassiliicoccus luminyensis]|uniref:lipoate--protein ligase family protein n=1 Tax=Methanomassiliicoccus luminyensis TaxID=1080712 RepID=UPI00191D0644|nr:biotin/lipoate A/B protein ligase family protein [Methanomassiliicoccus luminyensis]
MRWRMVPYARFDAGLNMAIDEAVAEAIARSGQDATMRFYGWEPSAVSIGCFQSVGDEVDLDECRRRGVGVVRRRTGGGAVFHDSQGEITYSVIAPEEVMGSDIVGSYRRVCGWVIDALAEIGLPAEFAPINDVTVGGKKVSGCAQTRRDGVFLQHGTVLYAPDREAMFSVLRVDPAKLADKGLSSSDERVTGIASLGGASLGTLLAALQRSFCRGKEWYEDRLDHEELARAEELSRTRYNNRDWTFSR